eukprot:357033-Chlamydomonas_euryale.AAC.2
MPCLSNLTTYHIQAPTSMRAAATAAAMRRWGYLSRAGLNDKSQLCRQIEKYADIYTSRMVAASCHPRQNSLLLPLVAAPCTPVHVPPRRAPRDVAFTPALHAAACFDLGITPLQSLMLDSPHPSGAATPHPAACPTSCRTRRTCTSALHIRAWRTTGQTRTWTALPETWERRTTASLGRCRRTEARPWTCLRARRCINRFAALPRHALSAPDAPVAALSHKGMCSPATTGVERA